MSFISGATPVIPAFFGNGVFGHAVTGVIRIPAFLASLAAVGMVAELAMRSLSGILSTVGFKPADGGVVENFSKQICAWGIRPYKTLETSDLLVRFLGMAILGVLATEFVNILGGTPPAIYNNVLTFVGPFRISNGSYIHNVQGVLSAIGLR